MSSTSTPTPVASSNVVGKNERTSASSSNNLKFKINLQSSLKNDSSDGNRRRSSSRSIKRKKFDDELVDSTSTSYPKLLLTKQKGSRINELSEKIPLNEFTVTDPEEPIAIPIEKEAPSAPPKKIQKSTLVSTVNPAPKKKSKKQSHVTNRYLGENNFWKPTDDLALIINVEQTNDLKKVYEGVKFSSKFSYLDIESRWRSLLYDKNIKTLSLAAIRQLHSDIVNSIESKALFSDAEESLLKKIEARKEPTLESLQKLIDSNAQIFLPSRTAKILKKHWHLLRHYNLLDDQSLKPQPRHESVVSFSEIENIVRQEIEEEMKNPELAANSAASCDIIDQEVAHSIRKSMLEVRMLENEIPKYQVLLDSITGVAPSDFDNQTYAVLRGRLVRYLMRSEEITIGRITKDFMVDVDLSLEGPSTSISRLQAVITLQPTGEFIIFNSGKRPIYIDAKPLLSNNSMQINHNTLIEFSSLKFIFLINQDLVSKRRNDILQSCK